MNEHDKTTDQIIKEHNECYKGEHKECNILMRPVSVCEAREKELIEEVDGLMIPKILLNMYKAKVKEAIEKTFDEYIDNPDVYKVTGYVSNLLKELNLEDK